MSRRIALLFLSLLSCGQKQYTLQECRELAAPQAFLDRCMGGKINGDYIGDLKCGPFSPRRLRGVLLTSGFEGGGFYPGAATFKDVRNMRAPVWPERNTNVIWPPRINQVAGGPPHAYLVDVEGLMSECDAWFGHQGQYPRKLIIRKFNSVTEIPRR